MATARSDSIRKKAGRKVSDLWEKIVGVDLKQAHIDHSGPLATAARREELLIAAAAPYLCGRVWNDSKRLAQDAYDEADASMKSPYGSIFLQGVFETLQDLRKHGLKLAIASTDTHKRTVESFRTLGIDAFFDVIEGSDDVTELKPSPMMILKILGETGTTSGEAVMVGDSVADMQMGKNAGLKACIGVLTGFTPKDSLEAFADVVICSVADLRTR